MVWFRPPLNTTIFKSGDIAVIFEAYWHFKPNGKPDWLTLNEEKLSEMVETYGEPIEIHAICLENGVISGFSCESGAE